MGEIYILPSLIYDTLDARVISGGIISSENKTFDLQLLTLIIVLSNN